MIFARRGGSAEAGDSSKSTVETPPMEMPISSRSSRLNPSPTGTSTTTALCAPSDQATARTTSDAGSVPDVIRLATSVHFTQSGIAAGGVM